MLPIILVTLYLLHSALGQEDPVVDTIYGSIRGSLQSNDIGRRGEATHSFLVNIKIYYLTKTNKYIFLYFPDG